jgi:hypothetical protein
VPVALPDGQLPMGGTAARLDLVLGAALVLLAGTAAAARRAGGSAA